MPDRRSVFVIHGRNEAARDEMGKFLRACGLKPINVGGLRAEMGGTPTVADIVEEGMDRAQGVVALFTPDEYAALRPEFRTAKDDAEATSRWQARPNVLFEAGMAFGKDRNRVVFVLLGDPKLFTDVAGIHVLRPTNDPSGDRAVLRDTLSKGMGCQVEDSPDWMRAGDFEGCIERTDGSSPRDPFDSSTAGPIAAPESEPTTDDARIILGGWLSRLDSRNAGAAFRYSEIAAQAGVTVDQARKLVAAVAATSQHWTVQQAGETVIAFGRKAQKIVRTGTRRGSTQFGGGGF